MYSSFIKKGSYVIVFDTIINDIPNNWWSKHLSPRPWNKKNNRYLSIGVGRREDKQSIPTDSTILETIKVGKIIQLDFNSMQPSGWGYGFMGRQRIQKDSMV